MNLKLRKKVNKLIGRIAMAEEGNDFIFGIGLPEELGPISQGELRKRAAVNLDAGRNQNWLHEHRGRTEWRKERTDCGYVVLDEKHRVVATLAGVFGQERNVEVIAAAPAMERILRKIERGKEVTAEEVGRVLATIRLQ